VTNRFAKLITPVPVSRPRRLALALSRLLAGSFLLGASQGSVRAELPVPAEVLVAPGAGTVLAPQISGNTMTIRQLSDKATLDWKSFNISAGSTVRFEQPATTSVALNNIHQADPSRIFGTLTANGQVFLVNQNGFVFGKDSQVNVNTLVASSLNISADTFKQGIARAFEQGLPALSAVDANGQPTKQLYLKDTNGQPVLDANGQKVKIQILVEAGASIKTNSPDGRVILAAPSITNKGDIEASGGQVIMAASQDKVYLQLADSGSGINGFLVEVGTGGDVNNIGKVLAEKGNASLIGFAVNQQGIASASTSVRINGSVRLLAREGVQDSSLTNGKLKPLSTQRSQDIGDGLGTKATLNLGSGSVTSVDLDSDKTQAAIDGQTQQPSKIELSGNQVLLRQNALVRAPAGDVAVLATDDPTKPLDDPNVKLVKGSARIYLESGSQIDVSGVKNVSRTMESNVIQVELRKNEMRDAPLQKDGILYGKKISVDVRDAIGESGNLHIPVADLQGAIDLITRNIDERSVKGGSISLKSTGDVIARPGSVLDFSGGSVAYQDGYIATTKLVDAEGRIYEIGKADPNRRYVSIFGEWVKQWTKWGITERWSVVGPLAKGAFEKGYVEGAAAGKVDIAAFEATLDGILKGGTTQGIRQRQTPAEAGSLSIDLGNQNLSTRQDVVFARNFAVNQIGPYDPLPRNPADSAQPQALTLDTALLKDSGIGALNLSTYGKVSVPQGSKLELPANATLDLAALGFDIQGSVVVPSGSVAFKPSDSGLSNPISLGSSALIDVRGTWVNDFVDSQSAKPLSPINIDGGSVNLAARQGDLNLAPGSRIDASAGAWYPTDLNLTAGKGGSISLSATTTQADKPASSLILGGSLSAWALHEGGALSLTTNEVVIGPEGSAPTRSGSGMTPLLLSPEFFQQGGFANYSIRSNVYGLKVADGVELSPKQLNLSLLPEAYAIATGGNPFEASGVAYIDRSPANLSLSYAGELAQRTDQALSLGQGSKIQLEPLGKINLTSDTSILANGLILAAGGEINLTLNSPESISADTGFFAAQGIWLGARSELSVAGTLVKKPAQNGFNDGIVLDGGKINLTANRGYIIAQQGSKLDASGTSSTFDFWEKTSDGSLVKVVQRKMDSSGGSINLTAAEGIIADGNLAAKAGGSEATGGALKVELTRLNTNKAPPQDAGGKNPFPEDTTPQTIVVSTASEPALPDGLAQGSAISSQDFNGLALLGSDKINDGGFSSITLKTEGFALSAQQYVNSILFKGDVSLKAEHEIILDAPSLAWQSASSSDAGLVSLAAAYTALGSTQSRIDKDLGTGQFSTQLTPEAKAGPGQLNVKAKAIELVGGLSFVGFGKATLDSTGDVRVRGIGGTRVHKDYLGELKLAGDLLIKADQIYPATLTDYHIAVSGSQDQGVTLQSSGHGTPVYSAGGSLTIDAPNISQQGILKAPFGELVLNASQTLTLAPGSITSVSGEGLVVPFGRGSANQFWLYPIDNQGSSNINVETPPEKRISLSGQAVNLQSGAKIDLSGGGDLYAYEFLPGPGGSNDLLDSASASYAGSFAVLPGVQSIMTPYDPLEFVASGLPMGSSVYLGAAQGLPAGQYTLLPAHYALLPGAYLITPRKDVGDLLPGQSRVDEAGINIVAGRYGVAQTAIADIRWSGFAVEQGSIARTRSEFKDYSANSFFPALAVINETALPQLPKDAGSLAIAGTASLNLGATLGASAVDGGQGGQVDIMGNKLAIVGRREDLASIPTGTVGILSADLNSFNAPSLLLGGVRSRDKTGQHLQVSAQSVTLSGDARLYGNEIILAAQDTVALASGAVLESQGKAPATRSILSVSNQNAPANSDGVLLWVSSAGLIDVLRDQTVTGTKGTLTVEAGAKLKSEGSMLLDSTKDTLFAGEIQMQGGSLGLKSSKISLGDAPADTSGLVLRKGLSGLDNLRLTSASDLNLYGGITLSAKQLLDINAAAINGYNNAGSTASLNADAIHLGNAGAQSNSIGTGSGKLSIAAGKDLLLGSGNYAIQGFQHTELTARQAIIGQGKTVNPVTLADISAGTGKLSVAGDLTMSAGRFRGEAGSSTFIDATGHALTLIGSGNGEVSGGAGLGSRWSLTADQINSTARFDLPAGSLAFNAVNGDLVLASGTAVDLSGRRLDFANLQRYAPAGSLSLAARQGSNAGSVLLESGALINLAAAVNSSNTQASDAGSLEIQVPGGHFDWRGSITAASGQASEDFLQARFSLDALNFGATGFSGLNALLGSAGFSGQQDLTSHDGSVVIGAGDTVKAKTFDLAVLNGSLTVQGIIDASGSTGGKVFLYGRDGITLASTALIDAHANQAGAEGGSVLLDTVHRADTGSGSLSLLAGSTIQVSGGTGGLGGAVHLRTGRSEALNTDIKTQVLGSDPLRTVLEATQVYDGISIITTDTIRGDTVSSHGWEGDTADFMASAAQPTNTAFKLLPGIEVRSSGDLTLENRWDFMDGYWLPDANDPNGIAGNWVSYWRYGDTANQNGLPGFLTLRAGGDLNIKASLTDAFATTPIPGIASFLRFQNLLQPGQSWSYHLVAGGNINLSPTYIGTDPALGLLDSSDRNSGVIPTDPNDPSINLPQQVMVRTGTGGIDLQAGGNISFLADSADATKAAAVYTMGRPAQYTMANILSALQGGAGIPNVPSPNPGESQADYLKRLDVATMNEALRYGYLNLSFDDISLPAARFLAEYPTQGGSITLKAGGNIKGIQTGQLVTDWLVRSGNWGNDSANSPTAWGINVSSDFKNEAALPSADGSYFYFEKGSRYFNQNIGALGGGDVSISAQGGVTDLSAMLPSTGKPFGIWNEQRQWIANGTVVNGGGNLSVSVGGNIVGGEFFTGLGKAKLSSGGNIGTAASGIGPLLELGDARFSVQARGDVTLGAAFNPTVIKQKIIADPGFSEDSYFFTYDPSSTLSLLSVAGDVTLQNNSSAIKNAKGLDVNVGSGFEFAVYPGTVRATALEGDIRIDNSLTLYPSPQGKLELLAGQDIGTAVEKRRINVNVSDADPSLLPGLENPARFLDGSVGDKLYLARERLDPMTSDSQVIHARTPVHEGSSAVSSIIAQSGNISSPDTTPFWWYMPQASQFIAGRDIRNLSLAGQNLSPTDVSLIQAGRDIRYNTTLDADGKVLAIDRKIQLGGPGQLQVLTGRNLNLGSSNGLLTTGNLNNTALNAQEGAVLSVIAGLSDTLDLDGFIKEYRTKPIYADQLAGLNNQSEQAKLKAVLGVLFAEIKESAGAAAVVEESKRASIYRQGYAAIAALFPGQKYAGDIALVFSQIKTLAGGDINLLVPGGKIDVGLAGKNGGISKKPEDLGIVVQQAGNLNGFAESDISVNQSRVFTMLGGDILLWSSLGNIDAGKGAKGAISAPPPITTIDQDGNAKIVFPAVVSGSGIQAVSPEDKTKRQGSVYLAAPVGIVNAGEAGISGNNVIIAAKGVIGAQFITSTSGTVGVPAAVTVPVVTAGADAAAAGAAKTATQLAAENASKPAPTDEKLAAKVAVSSLQADVVGFGQCSVGDVREGKSGCGG